MRAIPKHTTEGSPPLVGKIRRDNAADASASGKCSWWLATGFGVRGLLYHALMAQYLVRAVRTGDQSHIPTPLRRWQ